MLRPFEEEHQEFDGFGPTWLAAECRPASFEVPRPADDAATRKLIRQQAPKSPGVYGMVDADGRLIYVGKSKSLRDRLVTYFSSQSVESKAGRIAAYTKRLLWEPAPHEFSALVRELELIRRWLPRFNVRGRPGRIRRAYVGLGRDPAACVYLAEKPSKRDRLLVGPLWPSSALRHMIQRVNDCFQLRDCPDRVPIRFADQRQMFTEPSEPRCLRMPMGTCLGPCAGACSSRQYSDRVRAARDFLQGTSQAVLTRLQRAMRQAAAAEQFERAAALRDAWQELTGLHEMLEQLRTVRRTYSFIYPLPGYRGGEAWHLIHRGQIVAVDAAPKSRRTAAGCLRSLESVYSEGPRTIWQTTPDDPDLILIVSMWFKAHPEELERTLTPEAARLRCEALAPIGKAAS